MDMGDVDLANMIRSAIDLTRLSASMKGVQVTPSILLSPALVVGDSVRLLQVVWNLLSNAIKFTPSGGSIEIRLFRQENEACLQVHDTGAGISGDFIPHVFELFRQGDAESQHSPGLGIGLAIVAQIANLHGGTVHAESPGLGLGSTFTVTLPLVLPEAKQIASGSNIRSGRRSRRPNQD
jgi:signal transduction histidine kinase